MSIFSFDFPQDAYIRFSISNLLAYILPIPFITKSLAAPAGFVDKYLIPLVSRLHGGGAEDNRPTLIFLCLCYTFAVFSLSAVMSSCWETKPGTGIKNPGDFVASPLDSPREWWHVMITFMTSFPASIFNLGSCWTTYGPAFSVCIGSGLASYCWQHNCKQKLPQLPRSTRIS